jgi:23S rRNA (pseudouridine1915-N3)-methyltransferase
VLTLTLVCVGRAKAGAERDLAERYLDRAKLAGRALGIATDLREIGESRARRPIDRKAEEAHAIRAVGGTNPRPLIAFDETGRCIDSESFARMVRAALDNGTDGLNLVVGGPDGLDATIRDTAAHVLALGTMTWPHQLVRVMVAEQIYRAVTILSGHPYHRA